MEIKSILDSIRAIIERVDESKRNQGTEFEAGRLLAFNEVLSILKTDMIGLEEAEALLDFDIDERYS